jgi:hypothetical protein
MKEIAMSMESSGGRVPRSLYGDARTFNRHRSRGLGRAPLTFVAHKMIAPSPDERRDDYMRAIIRRRKMDEEDKDRRDVIRSSVTNDVTCGRAVMDRLQKSISELVILESGGQILRDDLRMNISTMCTMATVLSQRVQVILGYAPQGVIPKIDTMELWQKEIDMWVLTPRDSHDDIKIWIQEDWQRDLVGITEVTDMLDISYQGLDNSLEVHMDHSRRQLMLRMVRVQGLLKDKQKQREQGWTQKKLSQNMRVLTDVMALLRTVLMIVRPTNKQQTNLGHHIWGDLSWSMWRTMINPVVSSYSLGYGDIYAISGDGDAGEYVGSTWTFASRRAEHWREGGRAKRHDDGQDINDKTLNLKYAKAMRQRLYRMMHTRGVENNSMIAVSRVRFLGGEDEEPEASKQRRTVIKAQHKKMVERVEHSLARAVGSKLNEHGMMHNVVRTKHSMRPGTRERWKLKTVGRLRYSVTETRQRSVPSERKSAYVMSKFRIEGEDRYTSDMGQIMELVKDGDRIEAMNGATSATDWTQLWGRYGKSLIVDDGKECTFSEWINQWKKEVMRGTLVTITVKKLVKLSEQMKEGIQIRLERVRSAVRWTKQNTKSKKHWHICVKPDLNTLYEWEKVIPLIPGPVRESVRRKIRRAIKTAGGEYVPEVIKLRIPAGVTVNRTSIRRWWYELVDTVRADQPSDTRRRWKTALKITNGKAKDVGSILVNASRKCADVDMCEGAVQGCVCHDMSELVAVMKEKHSVQWKVHKHIHMPAGDVPWRVSEVGNVNMASAFGGCDKSAEAEFWTDLGKLSNRGCKDRTVGKEWLQQASMALRVNADVKQIDDRFNLGSVKEFKSKCERGEGLVRTVLDRDQGRMWLTCPALHAQFGRKHFKYAENETEWKSWDSEIQGDRPAYWRLNETKETVLAEWRVEYEKRSKEKCDNRWFRWDIKGDMTKARWQYKKKDVNKLRAIFNGTGDPAVREMEVAAKCIGLVKKTLGTNDFSLSSTLEMGEWLRETEQQLGDVYGEYTELRVQSTDFKNFFPSNKKKNMVKVLQRAIDLIMAGKVNAGFKVPVTAWMTIPRGSKSKALWGRRSMEGAQYRKTSDIVEYLDFRADIANAFQVGNVILQSEEVIIGEKISPGICELKVMLDEDELCLKLSENEMKIVRNKRYVDDGIRVIAVDSREVESEEKIAALGEKIAAAYSGIEVTSEGEATRSGGTVLFLELDIKVGQDGRTLQWHHHSKNIRHVADTGVQKFLKLKHWRSATFKNALMSTVRSRLCDIALLTREGEAVTVERGSGNLYRDVIQSTKELVMELHITLGYPMKALIALLMRMGRNSGLWNHVIWYIKKMVNDYEMELRDKEKESAERNSRWSIVNDM